MRVIPNLPEPPITVPPRVTEGGVLEIQASRDLEHVLIGIPGLGVRRVRVVAGRAEFRVPPGVTGGTIIFVGDGRYPNPYATNVEVVGAN